MEVEVKPWLLPVSCYDYEYFPFEWRERETTGVCCSGADSKPSVASYA